MSFIRKVRKFKRIMDLSIYDALDLQTIFETKKDRLDEATAFLQRLQRVSIRAAISQAVHVRVQNVSDYYWQTEQNQWVIDNDFPNVAPCWGLAWFEWHRPDTDLEGRPVDYPVTLASGQTGGENAALMIAIKIDWDDPTDAERGIRDGRKVGWVVYWIAFTELRDALIAYYDIVATTVTMMIDVGGCPIPHARDTATKYGQYRVSLLGSLKHLPTDYDKQAMGRMLPLALQSLHVPLLALSFANCKNVKVQTDSTQQSVGISRQKAKRILKAKNVDPLDAPVRWHVLEIQPMTKVIDKAVTDSTEDTPGRTGVRRGLHISRGHFKSYEEGKGLFGKHHGLYWWNQLVRGDKAKGKIIKDYDVKAAKVN